ncbi:thioesterase family protein [Anabaena sp. PCC 7108]|uniref:acyl-CoA thioesterase n=1 Tax=Anabaena sp. PCC 7108 TaxID=163908 RepID=UPI000346D026|nr:thioesterase family protein [Anabaena sp. PCC 7108]
MIFNYQRVVRFQDTDAAGVVYFANVLGICHEAYEESLISLDINLKTFFTNPSLAFPIVHTNVDFFSPMYCGDKLMIRLLPQKISVDKFEINYEITLNKVIVAKAMTRHVCIDVNSRMKQELPDHISNWLETHRKDLEGAERRKLREEIV